MHSKFLVQTNVRLNSDVEKEECRLSGSSSSSQLPLQCSWRGLSLTIRSSSAWLPLWRFWWWVCLHHQYHCPCGLFYSLLLARPCLPAEYAHHYSLLVYALYILLSSSIPYSTLISRNLIFAVFADTTASAKIIQRKFPTPMSARHTGPEPRKLFNENFVDSYPRNLSSAKLRRYTVSPHDLTIYC